MTWVSSQREPTGYDVRLSPRGQLIGFVRYERETGWWHFHCARCSGHAVDGSKAAAAEQAHEHWAIEHR